MPPKKAPPLQSDLETQADFDAFLALDGLKVVDVYAEWCGPCKVITGLLRKIKLDLSDDKLHFAVAKTDTIDALAAYRGRSEPTFLFYGGRDLVFAVRGADGGALAAAITAQLKAEHAVRAGGAARAAYVDPGPAEPVVVKEAAAAGKAPPAGPKEHTLALILPIPLGMGMRDEIFAAIAEAGFKVAHQDDDRSISADDARTLLAACVRARKEAAD
jgi:thiol-disulfide isomerase/thioredoxin